MKNFWEDAGPRISANLSCTALLPPPSIATESMSVAMTVSFSCAPMHVTTRSTPPRDETSSCILTNSTAPVSSSEGGSFRSIRSYSSSRNSGDHPFLSGWRYRIARTTLRPLSWTRRSHLSSFSCPMNSPSAWKWLLRKEVLDPSIIATSLIDRIMVFPSSGSTRRNSCEIWSLKSRHPSANCTSFVFSAGSSSSSSSPSANVTPFTPRSVIDANTSMMSMESLTRLQRLTW
mmetsp:Transcript_3882/g.9275  ORF Transcript_3882/g.9275 Transcript_3882/m.9275 type:complete len:232 (-) Transcript_3882:637-1332(-)